MSNLSVNFIEFFSAAAFRHLNMNSNEKIKVSMLPSEDGAFIIEKEKNEKLKSVCFKIQNLGKTFSFKISLSHNSKCSSLLKAEFINGLIWAIDPMQDYSEIEDIIVREESRSYIFHVEVDNYSDEIIILNLLEK